MEGRDFPGGPVVKTALPTQRAWVQSLVGELRSHKPHCAAQKKKKKKKENEGEYGGKMAKMGSSTLNAKQRSLDFIP